MIGLDKEHGIISFEKLSITSYFNPAMLEKIDSNIHISSGVKNNSYSSFILRNIENGEYSISIYFHKNKLKFISIFLGKNYEYLDVEKISMTLINKLNNIGGENTYTWGTVEFSDDRKGGVISIVIRYT